MTGKQKTQDSNVHVLVFLFMLDSVRWTTAAAGATATTMATAAATASAAAAAAAAAGGASCEFNCKQVQLQLHALQALQRLRPQYGHRRGNWRQQTAPAVVTAAAPCFHNARQVSMSYVGYLQQIRHARERNAPLPTRPVKRPRARGAASSSAAPVEMGAGAPLAVPVADPRDPMELLDILSLGSVGGDRLQRAIELASDPNFAGINSVDANGCTALHHVVKARRSKVAREPYKPHL